MGDDERKVICHLLPAYEPLSPGAEDFITLRHALVHLAPPSRISRKRSSQKRTVTAKRPSSGVPTSIGYAFFIIHPCHPDKQHRPLPNAIDSYSMHQSLPVLPVTLDAVLIAPSTSAFTYEDKPRLARIVFEFLASMDQEPRKKGIEWNGFVGQFTTQRIKEEEKCRSYIEFHRQIGEESVIVCAKAVSLSQLARLLLPRHSTSSNPLFARSTGSTGSEPIQRQQNFQLDRTSVRERCKVPSR